MSKKRRPEAKQLQAAIFALSTSPTLQEWQEKAKNPEVFAAVTAVVAAVVGTLVRGVTR